MTPKEALLASLVAERFAVYREPQRPTRVGWTAVEQAAHRAVLEEALAEDAATGPRLVEPQDVDDVAVARFVSGEDLTLSQVERHAAAIRLLLLGHTRAWVAERVGVSSTTLSRWLSAA